MAELQEGKYLPSCNGSKRSTSLPAILQFCNPAISRSFVRQHPRELDLIHLGDGRGAAQVALALGRLAVQDVLLERAPAQKFPVLRPLEALRGAAVCFQFGHDYFVSTVCRAAGFARPPPVDGLRLRIVCIWLPSIRGIVSAVATSRSSSTRDRKRTRLNSSHIPLFRM